MKCPSNIKKYFKVIVFSIVQSNSYYLRLMFREFVSLFQKMLHFLGKMGVIHLTLSSSQL